MSTVHPCARRQQMSLSIVPSPSAPHPIQRRSHDAASMDVVEPDRISNYLIAPIFALSLLLIPPHLSIILSMRKSFISRCLAMLSPVLECVRYWSKRIGRVYRSRERLRASFLSGCFVPDRPLGYPELIGPLFCVFRRPDDGEKGARARLTEEKTNIGPTASHMLCYSFLSDYSGGAHTTLCSSPL